MTAVKLRVPAALLPNLITFTRIPMTILLNAIILNCSHCGSLMVIICFSLLVYLTDFLDGRIARKRNGISATGAAFDVYADLFYISSSYLVLVFLGQAPLWFLGIIFLKFIEFVITSIVIRRNSGVTASLVFDLLGRITALLFYAVPLSVFLAHQLSLSLYLFAIEVLLPGITFISLASSGYRIFLCIASRNHKPFCE